MPPTDRPTRPRRRIWLAGSLVLNLFFIALIGGHALRAHGQGDMPVNPLARALVAAEDRLSAADANALRDNIRAHAAEFTPAEQKLVAARQGLVSAIGKPDFDRAQVTQAFDTWQSAWTNFVDTFQPYLVDALSHVSPEGRRELSDLRGRRGRIVP